MVATNGKNYIHLKLKSKEALQKKKNVLLGK